MNEYFLHVVNHIVQCKECKSQKIVQPANDAMTWIWKCLDCGNTKFPDKTETTTSYQVYAKDLDKPQEF